jgi:conjugative transposon TraM protein
MKNYLIKNWPLLFLPLVMIPFIVLIFYILGGGKAPQENLNKTKPGAEKVAINYTLPEADRTIGIVDKMEAVEARTERTATQDYRIEGEKSAEQIIFAADSTSAADEMQNEVKNETNLSGRTDGKKQNPRITSSEPGAPDGLMEHIRKQEARVRAEMKKAEQDTASGSKPGQESTTVRSGSKNDAKESDKLKTQLQAETKTDQKNESRLSTGTAIHPSTGIREMDELFDRSLALARQNDSLSYRLEQANLREKQRAEKEAGHYTLNKGRNNTSASGKPGNTNDPTAGAIPAEIYETTTVLTGNRVKIRLLEEVRLNGREIPRNTFVYGICRTDNERLQIDVQQIQAGGQFIPVKISVCDLDGLPGLYVPDNAARKITKEVGSGANTSSMVGFTGNPLAYAGVQAADRAARTVLQVIKQKKVTVKKNTLVYLINKNK